MEINQSKSTKRDSKEENRSLHSIESIRCSQGQVIITGVRKDPLIAGNMRSKTLSSKHSQILTIKG